MRLLITLFLAITIYSCDQYPAVKPTLSPDQDKHLANDTVHPEIILNATFNAFNTTVDVLFTDTRDSLTYSQKRNYEGFLSRQDYLTPEILKKVFQFYKDNYQAYKYGASLAGFTSDKELEKFLPKPTTPESLRPFIKPAIIHIQNGLTCKEGTLGIEFECTWDIENGLGVLIEDWQVKEVSVAEITYFR